MYTTSVKSAHKVLKLHHRKHTGKILAHKHTSYRVLFFLMLIPIGLMALIDQMVGASDLMVNAKVPAPMPSEAPVITSPLTNTTVKESELPVTGTCPVITPAVIIALYDNQTFVGSDQCSPEGEFSVPVSLSPGVHTLVATVVTITNDTGASSQPVVVTYEVPPTGHDSTKIGGSSVNSDGSLFGAPVRIVPTDTFVTIRDDGNAVWRGKFVDGQKPYTVRIDWGDRTTDTYTVTDEQEQTFAHDYKDPQTSKIVIEVTDGAGDTMKLYSVAITLSVHQHTGFGSALHSAETSSPIVSFLQKYVVHIYVFTLSSLVFLWYLEHGRHIVRMSKGAGRLRHR